MSGGAPPSFVTYAHIQDVLANSLTARPGRFTGSTFAVMSYPADLISPMLLICRLMKPPDGAYWRWYSASRVIRRQYVTSIAARS